MNNRKSFFVSITLFLFGITACSSTVTSTPSPEPAETITLPPPLKQIEIDDAPISYSQELYAKESKLWETKDIPVCWENPSSTNNRERRWVRDAINKTWAAHSALSFSGWGQCSEGSMGIRILIKETGPHTKGLGTDLNGEENGMVLNFGFTNWSASCQSMREYCIRTIAVHEFGHALSFAHEHNREDRPEECEEEEQGSDGDWYVTPYDTYSVMNYCNPNWSGDGKLSSGDIEGVQFLYGMPEYNQLRVRYSNGERMTAWQVVNILTNLTISDLLFGQFDTDAGADIFIATGSEWYVLYNGEGDLIWINDSGREVTSVKLSDFNGDGITDVFSSWGGHWYISESGKASWGDPIATSDGKVEDLGLGDFNGDGITDVFSSWGGQWYVSESGRTSWDPTVSSSNIKLDELGLGDFNGDGKTDIFSTWDGKWHIAENQTTTKNPAVDTTPSDFKFSAWSTVENLSSEIDVSDLRFFDFNRDGKTDVFAAWDGEWYIAENQTATKNPAIDTTPSDFKFSAWEPIGISLHNVDELRFVDFDGDGKTDVVTVFK